MKNQYNKQNNYYEHPNYSTTAIFKKAQKKIEKIEKEETINLDDFSDLYNPQKIKNDKEYIKKLKRKFKKSEQKYQEYKLGKILEIIIFEQIKKNNWFDENAIPIKTSEYDDFVNKIDIITEFQNQYNEFAYLGLAIDVTFNESEIENKIKNNITGKIHEGKLPKIKYFKSKTNNIRGEISNIPTVIIKTNEKTIEDLCKLWIKEDNQKLETHPLQFQILEDILYQLKSLKDYAQKMNQKELEIKYEAIEKIIEKIKQKKSNKLTAKDRQRNQEEITVNKTIKRVCDEVIKIINKYAPQEQKDKFKNQGTFLRSRRK